MQPKGLEKYQQYVDRLDRDARLFFELKFSSKEFEQTKSQVTDRMFAIKRIRSLARMFASPKTKLDLFKEMGEGKVILINAAKSLLQEDGVEVFGRFFLASILLAAEKRQLIAKDDRMPTFVYIDEAHDIIRRDEKISILLDQARKFRVAMILAHQRLDQLTVPVQNALFGSTAIKFAAQVSDANASALARNMRHISSAEPIVLHHWK
jgi:DNA helicase HerA-like ATPase